MITPTSSITDILKNLCSQLPLELALLKIFPSLKISRGLPRVYQKTIPSQSFIKKEFSDFRLLKKLLLEKLLLPRYKCTKDAKICIFTFMLNDGWGDLIAHKELFKVLKRQFPLLSSIVCIPKGFSVNEPNMITVKYDKEYTLSKDALLAIQNADLVISMPTYFPQIEELKKQCTSRWLEIAQYGFVESNRFSPQSGNYSMGLHFLELGILIRETKEIGDFRNIQNQTLLFTLFGTITPQTIDIEIYRASHKFYLAYLVSPIGGVVYLHALLQSQINIEKNIDICTPDIGWLVQYLQKETLVLEDFGIQDLEIHFSGKIHRREIAKKGKRVRIICPGPLSDQDFRNLMVLSEEFIAVRGDQSFSEVVSANRIFFYDGAPHARYFIKDLLALAQNKLNLNPHALMLFRSMAHTFAYNTPEEMTDWVEETFFQEKLPWRSIAKNIAIALGSPFTLAGFKHFNEFIKQEYSCNRAILQLASREIFYRFNPEKESLEKKQLQAFSEGKQTLKETLKKINRGFDVDR